jgi:hypothetical protein
MHLVLNIEPPPGKPGGSGANGMMVQKIPSEAFNDGNVDDETEVTAPILIAFNDRGDLHDKNTLTADPTDSNFVYAVWDFLDVPQGANIRPDRAVALGFKGAALFSRSTDGGETWSEPKVLYDPGGVNQTIANQIVVNPSGRLFNFFVEILNFRNDDKGAQFELNLSMKYSDDKGQTWLPRGRPIRIDKIQRTTILDPDQFGVEPPPFDRHRTGDIIIDPAVDPITGDLYVVWQDRRFTGRSSIAFTMSSDGGLTWSAPIQVNQTPVLGNLLNDQAFTASVHVLPNGTVGVSYYDFRNNSTGSGTDTDFFLVQCQAACNNPASWVGHETRVTVASFDSRQAPVARGFFLGDYVGLDNTGTAFSVLYTEGVSAMNPTDEFYSTVP